MQTNEITLVEQKDLREKYIDKIEVLEKVKSLFLIPKLEVMTTGQMAEYFEVDIEAIRKCYQRNKEEIDADGVIMKPLSDFKTLGLDIVSTPNNRKRGVTYFKIDDSTTVEINNCGIRCFSKRAILRIGMLLRDSAIAKEIRTQLLNTFENSTESQRISEIQAEETLYIDFVKTLINGTQEQVLTKFKNVVDYQNRHITELQNTITADKPKVEFAEAMIGNTTAVISVDEMAKLLHKNGFNIGQKKLFEFLREQKILTGNNVPYQKYINAGYFKLSETVLKHFCNPRPVTTTKVTQKGRYSYIIK